MINIGLNLTAFQVSVPIRGLFNLTQEQELRKISKSLKVVSVPIRGLFNLTLSLEQ